MQIEKAPFVCALVESAHDCAGWSRTPGNSLLLSPGPLPQPTPHHVAHGALVYSGSFPQDWDAPFTIHVPGTWMNCVPAHVHAFEKEGEMMCGALPSAHFNICFPEEPFSRSTR